MASALVEIASNLNSDGLLPSRDDLQPSRDGLQPSRDGLHPNSDGDGLLPPLT